jgi:hypothetical protein
MTRGSENPTTGSNSQRVLRISGVLVLALLFGCGAKSGNGDDGARRGAAGSFGNAAGAGAGGSGSGAGLGGGGTAGLGPVRPPPVLSDGGGACATASSAAQLEPVHLAFAFDVSGSMGKGDEPWHDKALKWDPVVHATRTFFEDDASRGLTASLTFFPEDGDEDERCVEEAYAEPDVEMTALPSQEFGAAIDAIEPMSSDDWRGGTPTVWVMRGTRGFVETYREDHRGRYAIVLVTDGYPQGCDDADDSVDAVVAVAEEARADGVDTYVIGVANPPIDDAPDTVSDLHAIAEAGGTQQAFLIDTGDPEATSSAFTQAIDAIRETAISCSLAIPEPPAGETFDKERVAVRYTGGDGATTTFTYDASCAQADAWHYDDPGAPQQIVLCENTCARVQSDATAAFEVEFACEQLFSVD